MTICELTELIGKDLVAINPVKYPEDKNQANKKPAAIMQRVFNFV